MSNLKRNLFIFCLLIFVSSTLISCSPEAVNVEMEIITFSSFKDTTATKYPAEIIEIGKPLDKKNFSTTEYSSYFVDLIWQQLPWSLQKPES